MNNVKVAVAVIVNQNKQILVTQRNSPDYPPTHMKWQLPGGGVEKNETPESACIREALEETGLVIKLLSKYPAIIKKKGFDGKDYTFYGFKAEAVSGTIDVGKDIETADAKWIILSQIKKLKMLDDTLEMIEMCLL